MELIRLENIHKTYHLGEIDVPVLKGISLIHSTGRDGCADRRFRIRQDHLNEYPRLSGPPVRASSGSTARR